MTQLPADPVLLEQTLCAAIRDTLVSVPLIAQYCKVELRERFPDSDEDDIRITTIEDPAQRDLTLTSIIQIGMPSVTEKPYTSEKQTQLDFTYPITFDLGVVDEWNNADGALVYTNSWALAMAIYMSARAKFKENRELGGFASAVHDYLQQDSAATVEDEESGGDIHAFDWTLVVHVKGVNF
jgi:hypothetical protein